MVVWISRALVLSIHERQLAEHGGASGVRDDALLESALARPPQLSAYGDPPPDLAAPAASVAFGLTRHHPFVDGKKRNAAVGCVVLLMPNGSTLQSPDHELYLQSCGLAEGSLDEAGFADWLRPCIAIKPGGRVQETADSGA